MVGSLPSQFGLDFAFVTARRSKEPTPPSQSGAKSAASSAAPTAASDESRAKDLLRSRAKKQRQERHTLASRSPDGQDVASDYDNELCRGIWDFLVARNQVDYWTVLFAAMPDEPQLAPLVAMFANSGPVSDTLTTVEQPDVAAASNSSGDDLVRQRSPEHARLALTRTPSTSMELTLHPWASPLERHRYGFMQPAAESDTVPDSDIGVVLVPGLAFDRLGGRLGFGAGYYDRLLQRLIRTVGVHDLAIVGVCDGFVVDRVPTQSHDIAMTHVATSAGVEPIEPSGTLGSQGLDP